MIKLSIKNELSNRIEGTELDFPNGAYVGDVKGYKNAIFIMTDYYIIRLSNDNMEPSKIFPDVFKRSISLCDKLSGVPVDVNIEVIVS